MWVIWVQQRRVGLSACVCECACVWVRLPYMKLSLCLFWQLWNNLIILVWLIPDLLHKQYQHTLTARRNTLDSALIQHVVGGCFVTLTQFLKCFLFAKDIWWWSVLATGISNVCSLFLNKTLSQNEDNECFILILTVVAERRVLWYSNTGLVHERSGWTFGFRHPLNQDCQDLRFSLHDCHGQMNLYII